MKLGGTWCPHLEEDEAKHGREKEQGKWEKKNEYP